MSARHVVLFGFAIIVLSGFVIIAGCTGSGRTVAVSSPPSSATVRPAAVAAPVFTEVTLERRPCFGTCPVFVVRVTGAGAVTFEGKQHVDSTRGSARLSASQLTSLAMLFDDNSFFTLDDKYIRGAPRCGAYASDAPTVITSITTTTRTKRIEHNLGCSEAPASLTALESRIEEIVGVSRWIGRR
jgi:hypothetical protein